MEISPDVEQSLKLKLPRNEKLKEEVRTERGRLMDTFSGSGAETAHNEARRQIGERLWERLRESRLLRRLRRAESGKETMTKAAYTDELTGLPNRRFFNERLKQEMINAELTGTPLAVGIIDFDRFKEVNDSYGHNKGDVLLFMMANMLRHSFRKSDFVARLGGDEFAVILPGAKNGDAEKAAEKARSDVENGMIEYTTTEGLTKTATPTATIGLTSHYPGSPMNASDLLRQADIALYHAKESGKNRVFVYREGITMPEGLPPRRGEKDNG